MKDVRPERQDALALAALALLATLFFADVLAGRSALYLRDVGLVHYPMARVFREVVLGGEFPYWNRFLAGGQPLAANPEHQVFYPLKWLVLLPDFDLGFRLHIVLHVYIALAAMYALLRSMALRPLAAFLGALSWGGGAYLSYTNLLPYLFSIAWMPLTLLFARRLLLAPSRRDLALAAFFLGMQAQVGEPTTLIQTGILVGAYALYRAWYERERAARLFGSAALIGVAGLVVGAAQILPAIDFSRDTVRSRGLDFGLVGAWSMPWLRLVELLAPGAAVEHFDREALYPGMAQPFLYSIYLGLLVIVLALAGAWIRPRGGRLVLVLIAFSVLIAAGAHTPLLSILYQAHIAAAIRYPEKFLLLGLFAIAVFGAQMLDRLLEGDERLRRAAIIVALAVATLAFLAIPFMARHAVLAAVRGALLAALLALMPRLKRPIWGAAAVAFVVADLALPAMEVCPRITPAWYEPPPIVAALPPDRGTYRIFHSANWLRSTVGRPYFGTRVAIWTARNGLFPFLTAANGFRTVLDIDQGGTQLLPTADFTDAMWSVRARGRPDWDVPFMAMSNAWYRTVYRDFDSEYRRTGGDPTRVMPVAFLERAHVPRYYFADRVVRVRDRHELVLALAGGGETPQTVFADLEPFRPAAGVVQRVVETANSAAIDVESSGRALLVMSVTPHRYWHVGIDGAVVRPLVANIGYQAVEVPAGRHRVTMRYANPLLFVGVVISLAAIAACLACFVAGSWWPKT